MSIYQPTNSLGNYNYNAWYYDNCEWHYHFHTNYEAIYVEKGFVEAEINGRKIIISEGEFAMILPNQFHSYKTPESSKAWVGVFSSDYVRDFHKIARNKTTSNPVFKCEEGIKEYLVKYLIFQGTPDRMVLKSCLYALCSEFSKNAQLEETGIASSVISEILKYLAETPESNMTMKDLAKHFGYEYHYFSRFFHKCFNMNFRQLVNIFKISRAIEELTNTERAVTDIALGAGFSSIRSFNRVFLSHTGYTPTLYREKVF